MILAKPQQILAETTSTNDLLKEMFRDGASAGTLLQAKRQTAGRGRQGRSWWSPKRGALLFSLLLPFKKESGPLTILPLIVAVAMARAIEKTCKFKVSLKWPNDILISNKKCGGILCETISREINNKKERAIICGIGLNCQVEIKQAPAEIIDQITSLHLHSKKDFKQQQLLKKFISELNEPFNNFFNGQKIDIRSQYLPFAIPLNSLLTLHTERGKISGTFYDLAEDGALLLKTISGKVERHYSAMVEFKGQ